MKTLHFSTLINAPKEIVWHAMLDDAPYREWTRAFGQSGYYKGNWEKGSKMWFLGPNPETGEEGGMVSMVEENTPYESMSLKHIGIIKNGVEDTTSADAKKWTPAFENYLFTEKDGKTEVRVDIDVADEEAQAFEKMWADALVRLKSVAEKKI